MYLKFHEKKPIRGLWYQIKLSGRYLDLVWFQSWAREHQATFLMQLINSPNQAVWGEILDSENTNFWTPCNKRWKPILLKSACTYRVTYDINLLFAFPPRSVWSKTHRAFLSPAPEMSEARRTSTVSSRLCLIFPALVFLISPWLGQAAKLSHFDLSSTPGKHTFPVSSWNKSIWIISLYLANISWSCWRSFPKGRRKKPWVQLILPNFGNVKSRFINLCYLLKALPRVNGEKKKVKKKYIYRKMQLTHFICIS